MILVDSSVWIAQLRGQKTRAVAELLAAAARQALLVGDLILLEVLQGARDDANAAKIERSLRQHVLVHLLDDDLASRAAKNYRQLRSLGITIRSTPDIIIGTYCIKHGHRLVHDDRDFLPMERHLGLMAA